MYRVSLCPHCLVFLLGGLWENLIFVGAIFIWLTNFPRGPRGLPLAIYLFIDNYCGVRVRGIVLPMCSSPAILSLFAIKGDMVRRASSFNSKREPITYHSVGTLEKAV
jgi:hypothetical protein